jgi:hypothetical protein
MAPFEFSFLFSWAAPSLVVMRCYHAELSSGRTGLAIRIISGKFLDLALQDGGYLAQVRLGGGQRVAGTRLIGRHLGYSLRFLAWVLRPAGPCGAFNPRGGYLGPPSALGAHDAHVGLDLAGDRRRVSFGSVHTWVVKAPAATLQRVRLRAPPAAPPDVGAFSDFCFCCFPRMKLTSLKEILHGCSSVPLAVDPAGANYRAGKGGRAPPRVEKGRAKVRASQATVVADEFRLSLRRNLWLVVKPLIYRGNSGPCCTASAPAPACERRAGKRIQPRYQRDAHHGP